MSRSVVMWNTLPGSTWLLPSFSDTLQSFPFFYPQLGRGPGENFTAVIYATTPVMLSSSPLFRLIRTIAKSAYIHKVRVCDTLDYKQNNILSRKCCFLVLTHVYLKVVILVLILR